MGNPISLPLTSDAIRRRLAEKGLTLPEAPSPVGSYGPRTFAGDMLFISGQIARLPDGTGVTGRLGDTLDVAQGAKAAEICALNLLAQLEAGLEGDWSRLVTVARLNGFVAATPEFTDHPKVINGASDLMESVLGAAGTHTRTAVGVASLPLGVAVEIDAIVQVRV